MLRRPYFRIAAIVLFSVLAGFGILACRPKTGADRFLGTYRWRLLFFQQVVTLGRNGKATYVTVTPGTRANEKAHFDSLPATYRVVGDTAFLAISGREPSDSGQTLAMLLRGDTLVMLGDSPGGTMTFVRD